MRNILYPILFFIATLFIVEFYSFNTLKDLNRAQSFMYDHKTSPKTLESMQQAWGKILQVSFIDPLLGYARKVDRKNDKLAGYEVIGAGNVKILILGGSTTSSYTPIHLDNDVDDFQESYSWPRYLADIIGKDKVTIYNGAVAGYFSSTELLKLIRDINFIKPDIVITLNGVNELENHHGVKGYQLLGKYEKKITEHAVDINEPRLMPNTVTLFRLKNNIRLVEGIDFGPKHNVINHDKWLNNIIMSKAVSDAFGAKYFIFLQPALGLVPENQQFYLDRSMKQNYIERISLFYSHAREHCKKLSYCTSLEQIIPDDDKYYIDPRHQTRAGTEIVAKNIYTTISK